MKNQNFFLSLMGLCCASLSVFAQISEEGAPASFGMNCHCPGFQAGNHDF